MLSELGAEWQRFAVVVVAAVVAYTAVIAMTRLAGLRSLAQMSSFDFAATVAVGSTLSSTITGSVPLAAGVLALAMLFLLQYVVATLRRRGLLGGAADNAPMLLMAGPEVLEDNLRHVRLSRQELWSQLRQAGVHSRSQVHAVVMETTGSISVLRTGEPVDDELLAGVRGAEALR
ncbi:MAG TPA: YetF domain-containing protein [Mycobacteriales bacterium]|nr:YetF domain-containing protein [Mycobacteriales bacterium]